MKQDSKVAELMLNHSRYQDCQDVEGFKTEMAAVVNAFRENTITLGTVCDYLIVSISELYV